jgi:SAM-dependent methyltransferase
MSETHKYYLTIDIDDERPGFQNVIAVDPSPNMVQVAKEGIPEHVKSRVEFRHSTAEDLSFIENGTVDLVTAGMCAFSDRVEVECDGHGHQHNLRIGSTGRACGRNCSES